VVFTAGLEPAKV